MHLFDSHCHLNAKAFDGLRNNILIKSRKIGLTALCNPSTTASEWNPLISQASLSLKQQELGVRQFVALGLHPCLLSHHELKQLVQLDLLLAEKHSSVVAIGEIGLDFYDKELDENDRAKQLDFFTEQLILANLHNLPVIIHARKSHEQILKTLRKYNLRQGGVIHAFSGSEQQALQYIELGFKIGIGGNITYPRARKIRNLVSSFPLEAIVLETDAPDMPLNGFQGITNTPDMILMIANCMANLRKESVQHIAKITTRNSLELFNIPINNVT